MAKRKNGKRLTTRAEKKQISSLNRRINKARTIRNHAMDKINNLQSKQSTIFQRAKKRKKGKGAYISRLKSKRTTASGKGWSMSWS